MDTIPLSILICSNNEATIHQMTRTLTGEGVHIQTSDGLIDYFRFSKHTWDYLLIDLDGLDSYLRNLLPHLFAKFPDLPRIGISTKSASNIKALDPGFGLDLDAWLSEIPEPEDLIVLFPQVADRYLCDSSTFKELMPSSPNIFQDGIKSLQVEAYDSLYI